MTDQEIVQRVQKAIDELNKAGQVAAEAGITLDVTTMFAYTVGGRPTDLVYLRSAERRTTVPLGWQA